MVNKKKVIKWSLGIVGVIGILEFYGKFRQNILYDLERKKTLYVEQRRKKYFGGMLKIPN